MYFLLVHLFALSLLFARFLSIIALFKYSTKKKNKREKRKKQYNSNFDKKSLGSDNFFFKTSTQQSDSQLFMLMWSTILNSFSK